MTAAARRRAPDQDAILVLDGDPASWTIASPRRAHPHAIVVCPSRGRAGAAVDRLAGLLDPADGCVGVAVVVDRDEQAVIDPSVAGLQSTPACAFETFAAHAGALAWARGRVDAVALAR
ncbi:MAG: hypothetical protein M3482_05250 [Actinomycetota bacterium]|nr:hypothetical protein [Actinomycetota bacterium]